MRTEYFIMLHASWICYRVSALVYTKMMHCIYPCTWHCSLYIAYVRRHGLREDSLALRGKTWNSPTGTRHMVLRYPRWDRGSFDPSGRGYVIMCCIPWEHVLSPVFAYSTHWAIVAHPSPLIPVVQVQRSERTQQGTGRVQSGVIASVDM